MTLCRIIQSCRVHENIINANWIAPLIYTWDKGIKAHEKMQRLVHLINIWLCHTMICMFSGSCDAEMYFWFSSLRRHRTRSLEVGHPALNGWYTQCFKLIYHRFRNLKALTGSCLIQLKILDTPQYNLICLPRPSVSGWEEHIETKIRRCQVSPRKIKF